MDLELSSSDDGGRAILALTGAVDIESREPLQAQCQRLLGGGPVALVLDMSGVTFMDSTGIGALVEVSHAARDSGITFTIRRPSTRVVRILQASGLSGMWDVEETTS